MSKIESFRYYFVENSKNYGKMYFRVAVEHTNLDEYRIVFWSGNIEDTNMLLHTYRKKRSLDPLYFHR